MPRLPDVKLDFPARTRRGQFAKGTSGNPSGRPCGSRNKATLLAEQLIQDDAEAIVGKLVELAKKGEPHALRLCVERLVSVRKERTIDLDVRPMENTHDLPLTFPDVLIAVAEGRITPGEGQSLANMMVAHSQNLQANELARRVQELESHLEEIRRCKQERDQILQEAARES